MNKREFKKIESNFRGVNPGEVEINEETALAIIKYAPFRIKLITNPTPKVAKAIEKYNAKSEVEFQLWLGRMKYQDEKATAYRALLVRSGLKPVSTSKTTFGVSVYAEYKGRKVRVSDHCTGPKRWYEETQFIYRNLQEIPETIDFNA